MTTSEALNNDADIARLTRDRDAHAVRCVELQRRVTELEILLQTPCGTCGRTGHVAMDHERTATP